MLSAQVLRSDWPCRSPHSTPQIVVAEQPKQLYKFLTAICAVIGGVFTVAGEAGGTCAAHNLSSRQGAPGTQQLHVSDRATAPQTCDTRLLRLCSNAWLPTSWNPLPRRHH